MTVVTRRRALIQPLCRLSRKSVARIRCLLKLHQTQAFGMPYSWIHTCLEVWQSSKTLKWNCAGWCSIHACILLFAQACFHVHHMMLAFLLTGILADKYITLLSRSCIHSKPHAVDFWYTDWHRVISVGSSTIMHSYKVWIWMLHGIPLA